MEKVDLCCDRHGLFRTAKQMVGEMTDIVGVSCLKYGSEAVNDQMISE